MKKKLFKLLLLCFVCHACSEKQPNFDDYASYDVSTKLIATKLSNGKFSMSIPIGWNQRIEDNLRQETLANYYITSPVNAQGVFDVLYIQVLRYPETCKTFKGVIENQLAEFEKTSKYLKLVGQGKTTLFSKPAYYLHLKSDTGVYGEVEQIFILIDGGEGDTYYRCTLSASQTEDIKKQMGLMLSMVKSFRPLRAIQKER